MNKASAFTLLELCLAIFIAVIIMLAAVPSIEGVVQEARAKRLFTKFDDMAKEAGNRAVKERRPYVLEWDDDGVTMHPLAPQDSDTGDQTMRVDFGKRAAPALILPASLMKNPPRVWTFWPTGTCEPATIICKVEDSPFTATYDPLTEQPVFTSP
jgi:Tfp pilus assembly protein PilE